MLSGAAVAVVHYRQDEINHNPTESNETNSSNSTEPAGTWTAGHHTLLTRKEEWAGNLIAKVWNSRDRLQRQLIKSKLESRLDLENSLVYGMLRLVLFCSIFILMVQVTSFGSPPKDKRSISLLLTETLGLDDFLLIQDLQGVKSFLPEFSKKIKMYSVSGSNRIPDDAAVQIVSSTISLHSSLPLLTIDPGVENSAFTLCSWVRAEPSAIGSPLLRKPLPKNPSLSCWGWFYPSQFRYGAHDFHPVNSDSNMEVVLDATDRKAPPAFSHEALVAQGSTLRFYRNGRQVGETVQLPRPITNCLGTVHLGDDGLELSAAKFYPRALLPNELGDIYAGGAPLSEIATSAVLRANDEDPFAQLKHAAAASQQDTTAALDVENARTAANLLISKRALAENDEARESALYTQDDSPPAPLALAPEMAALLPPRELARWQAQGGPANLTSSLAEVWRNETARGIGPYWAVWDGALYVENYGQVFWDATRRTWVNWDATRPLLFVASFPSQVPQSTTAVTLTFWSRSLWPRNQTGFRVVATDSSGRWKVVNSQNNGQMQENGVFSFNSLGYGIRIYVWDAALATYYTRYFPFAAKAPDMGQRFLLSPNQGLPVMAAWRFLALRIDFDADHITFFLDGRRALDWQVPFDLQPSIFDGKKVRLYSHNTKVPHPPNYKIGQLRMYLRGLGEPELLYLMGAAKWSNGKSIQQCFSSDTDTERPKWSKGFTPLFGDPYATDEYNHDCLWYARAVANQPKVCESAFAKTLCPMTCKGRVECHDGSFVEGFSKRSTRRTYAVFDRIMHLKPRKGASTVICPAQSLDEASLIAACRASQGNVDRESGEYNDAFVGNNWSYLDRGNVSNCDDLARRIDYAQCAWDDSWLSDFRAEYAQTQSYSFSFWIKPKPGSKGMPDEFWPSLNLIARFAPAFSLGEIYPPNGHQEIKYYFQVPRYSKLTEFGPFQSVDSLDFDMKSKWNFFFGSVERQVDGTFRTCLALNGLPMNCINPTVPGPADRAGGGRIPVPETLLQGIELSTEALISPIEFTAGGFSISQLQRKFYGEFAEMESMPGPRTTENDRLSAYNQVEEKTINKYDERIVLAAPPILFQTRAIEGQCSSPVIIPFLHAQEQLINVTQCSMEGQCPNMESPYMCKLPSMVGPESSYYGLNQTELEGMLGFADFLYTFADNSFIVRDDELLDTDKFLDSQTEMATVWTLFLSPEDGMLVALKLMMHRGGSALGAKIVTDTKLSFLDSLNFDARIGCTNIFVALMVLIGTTVIVNLCSLAEIIVERRRWPKKGWDIVGIIEVIYDLVQVIICTVYLCILREQQMASEDSASRLVERFAAVPFADANMTFSEKVSRFFQAAQSLKDSVDRQENITSFGFAILILMLVRVLKSTAVHPRIAMLTSSIRKGLQDLWHFGLLLVLVFFFFGMTACWMFADQYEDYQDLNAALDTQFGLLTRGDMPNGYERNPALVVHIVLTTVLIYFLMLNFLLAIVVESYMAVRKELETNEVSSDFVTDVVTTFHRTALGIARGWPSRRDVANVLRFKIIKKSVSARILRIASGYPSSVVRSIVETYFSIDCLQAKASAPKLTMQQLIASIRKKAHPAPEKESSQQKAKTVLDSEGMTGTDNEKPPCCEKAALDQESLQPSSLLCYDEFLVR